MHITTIPAKITPQTIPQGQTLESTQAAKKRAQALEQRLQGVADRLAGFDEKTQDHWEGVGQVEVENQTYRWLSL